MWSMLISISWATTMSCNTFASKSRRTTQWNYAFKEYQLRSRLGWYGWSIMLAATFDLRKQSILRRYNGNGVAYWWFNTEKPSMTKQLQHSLLFCRNSWKAVRHNELNTWKTDWPLRRSKVQASQEAHGLPLVEAKWRCGCLIQLKCEVCTGVFPTSGNVKCNGKWLAFFNILHWKQLPWQWMIHLLNVNLDRLCQLWAFSFGWLAARWTV